MLVYFLLAGVISLKYTTVSVVLAQEVLLAYYEDFLLYSNIHVDLTDTEIWYSECLILLLIPYVVAYDKLCCQHHSTCDDFRADFHVIMCKCVYNCCIVQCMHITFIHMLLPNSLFCLYTGTTVLITYNVFVLNQCK